MKELTIPEGRVVKLYSSGKLLWERQGDVQTFDHLDKAETRPVDKLVGEVSVDEFDVLVLPGGVANPDALRMDQGAVSFIGDFVRSGKPVRLRIIRSPQSRAPGGYLI